MKGISLPFFSRINTRRRRGGGGQEKGNDGTPRFILLKQTSDSFFLNFY